MGKGQMWNSVNQWLQIDADIQIFGKYMTLSLTQELQENVNIKFCLGDLNSNMIMSSIQHDSR